jgi:hypothetical protein
MTDALQSSDAQSAAVSVAPRVTYEDLKAKVAAEEYFTAGPDGILTICVLTMANGFTVTGESAPASPENFDANLGCKYAYEAAMRKAWSFEGYLLRERLSAGSGA